MHLVIRAQSLRHESVSQSIVAEFDERGGTIGRSDSNTMTLPDPERHVSRLQAEISCAAGAYALRNVGSANPIIVNGRPLSPGEAVTLRDADQLTIGSYELRVELGAQGGKAPAHAVDARTVIGASAREVKTDPPRQPTAAAAHVSSDPFAGLLNAPARAGAADPFADLLGVPSAPPPSQRAASAPQAHATPAPKAASPPPRLPDDFDPFAELSASMSSPSPTPSPPSPFDAPLQAVLGHSAALPGIDTLFDLSNARPGQADPLAAFLSAGDAAAAPSHTDPFAFIGGVGAPLRNDVGAADADHTPDLQAAYMPPPIRRAAAVPQPALQPAPCPPPPPLGSDSNTTQQGSALWDAFCSGAQISLPSHATPTPELMRLIGATLREAVDGTLQLSAMRNVVKQELHVPVTTIRANGNNPLKFAPDATAALMQLLQPPMRGFMAAPEAMQDAMTDLLGHTAGTMEGTRAAMQGMLRRFEPAQLEAQLAEGGMLDRLMPGNRRARLWELYLQHHGRIGEAAREDFAELFGRAFVRAYEEHADRVAAARRARP